MSQNLNSKVPIMPNLSCNSKTMDVPLNNNNNNLPESKVLPINTTSCQNLQNSLIGSKMMPNFNEVNLNLSKAQQLSKVQAEYQEALRQSKNLETAVLSKRSQGVMDCPISSKVVVNM